MFLLAIWNEHQTKIDLAHKLLRSAQDKLEEQIKMRKEQVSIILRVITADNAELCGNDR